MIDELKKDEELIIEDDNRYVMASPGIMVANDKKALTDYYKSAKSNRQKQEELNTIKSDMKNLTQEVSELKSLIYDLHAKMTQKD